MKFRPNFRKKGISSRLQNGGVSIGNITYEITPNFTMASHDEDCDVELFTDIKTEICAKPYIKINVLEKNKSEGPKSEGNKILKLRDMYSKTDDNIRTLTQYPQIITQSPDIVPDNTSRLELGTNRKTTEGRFFQSNKVRKIKQGWKDKDLFINKSDKTTILINNSNETISYSQGPHISNKLLHKFNDQTVNAFNDMICNRSKQNENVKTAHAIKRERSVKPKFLKRTTSVGDENEESKRSTLFPLKFLTKEIKTKFSLPTINSSFTKGIKYKLSRQNSKVQVTNYTENNNACGERKECKFPLKEEDITTKISKSYSIELKKTTTKPDKTEHYPENISKNRGPSQNTISSSKMTQIDDFPLNS